MIDVPSPPATILVVDDEVEIRRLLRACLERDGYRVAEAATGDEAIGQAIRRHPSAVLLDTGLPDMDGLLVLRRLREWSQMPVLIISDSDHHEEKITALDSGANDYITKPFHAAELMARLRVTQRFYSSPGSAPKAFEVRDITVDLTSRTVMKSGRRVKLTPTEYSLLRLFVQNAGKVLTHRQILREIWGFYTARGIGYIRVYLTYLREKLENNPAKPE